MTHRYDPENREYTVTTRADGFAIADRGQSNPYDLHSKSIFALRKNGVLVAEGAGGWKGKNLTYFPVPGTEAMLRGVLDDMVAEHDRAIEAEQQERNRKDEQERLARKQRERVEASAVLGLQPPTFRDFDQRVKRLKIASGLEKC